MTIIEKHQAIKIFIDTKFIGECLRKARKQSNILRRDLAQSLGVSNNELLKIESGRCVIGRHVLTKLFQIGIEK